MSQYNYIPDERFLGFSGWLIIFIFYFQIKSGFDRHLKTTAKQFHETNNQVKLIAACYEKVEIINICTNALEEIIFWKTVRLNMRVDTGFPFCVKEE